VHVFVLAHRRRARATGARPNRANLIVHNVAMSRGRRRKEDMTMPHILEEASVTADEVRLSDGSRARVRDADPAVTDALTCCFCKRVSSEGAVSTRLRVHGRGPSSRSSRSTASPSRGRRASHVPRRCGPISARSPARILRRSPQPTMRPIRAL